MTLKANDINMSKANDIKKAKGAMKQLQDIKNDHSKEATQLPDHASIPHTTFFLPSFLFYFLLGYSHFFYSIF